MRFLACFGVLDPILAAYMLTSMPTQTHLAAGPMAASDPTADLADGGGVGLATSAAGFGSNMRSVDDIADSGLLGGA